MSTKTTFKRIALVAVAALGLGVLSVAPSSATVSGLAIAVTNGTSTVGGAGNSDSSTAGTVNVTALFDAATDSATVQMVLKSKPSTGADIGRLYYLETSTALGNGSVIESVTAGANGVKFTPVAVSSASLQNTGLAAGANMYRIRTGVAGYVGGKFIFQLDSTTAGDRVVGTYTYTLIAKSYSSDANGVSTLSATATSDISIVIADSAANVALLGSTVDGGRSTSWMNSGSTFTTASDSAVAVVSTASATDVAIIRTSTFNSDGNATPESVTATVTGAGVICSGTICGKSLKMLGTAGVTDLTVRADGTAGTSSIVIATTSKTFPAKTLTFYAKAAKTLTASVNKPVIGTAGDTDVIRVAAVDADGNNWGGTAYIYAATAADALLAGSATPVACTYSSTYAANLCPVTGIATGTANFKVIDAATVAAATATSASVAVRVSTGVATTAKIAFDKATYAPGEKAQILVTAVDAAGLALASQTITNIFTSTGITSSSAFSSGSASLTSADAVISGNTSSSSGTVAGYQVYVVYMPLASGVVTISATGSTGLALAGRVALSASAEVVNSSVDAATDAANEATDAANAATDAALAAADAADAATAAAQDASDAVAALSATVAKLVASLKAQITSLTNLVIKIQKKVKA